MKILLQHKIFIGYFLLMAIIGSMVAIVLHERSRVQKIENESIAIFQTQHNINTTHRYVTTLVTYGESVMVWNDEDSGGSIRISEKGNNCITICIFLTA